jgi:stearoyl-CoA desaturase (delta-9 desaturase)
MLLLSAYLVPAMILWNAGSFINTLTHMTGYRNHETNDNSTNIPLLGILMWGEGWHNNHHWQPSNASFKFKWWEFDLGGWFITLLEDKNGKDSSIQSNL